MIDDLNLYFSTNLNPIILGFILVFTIRLLLLSLDSLFIDDGYTIQYLIFMISTWLLVTGIEVGYSKLIFNKIDLIPTNIKNIFNHFSLLPTYIGGIIINVCILILSIRIVSFCIMR